MQTVAPKVQQMTSKRSGNPVANQFLIATDKGVYFQSYETIIGFREYGIGHKITLDDNALHYSRTTSKYLYEWLGYNRKEIEGFIKDGVISTKNLNKG